jgi:predicted outer membrane repeat protein
MFNLYGQFQRAYLGFKWGYGNAGVIVSQASNITLSGVSFERNRAELGAAIFAVDSAIEIRNNSFKNNQALCAVTSVCLGGILYSDNSNITIQFSNFQNNSVTHIDDISGVGGVFALFEGSVSIHNSYFASNVAAQGSGGVIYAQRTHINITASSFFYNRAARFGRVIRSPQGTFVTDSNSHYEGNTAGFEGGVMFLEKATLKFIKSKLLFNKAETFGGAVRVYIGTLQFYECDIFGNIADKGGGAVSVNSVHLYISNSNFTANTAIENYYYGGAIRAINSKNITILDSIFALNEGSNGGVLSVQDTNAPVSIKFSFFTSNIAWSHPQFS